MSSDRKKALKAVCTLFVGLGFAMCHVDGVLKREEGRALAKALNALLDHMGAGKELRDQVPGMLTSASKHSSRKAGPESSKAAVEQLLVIGRQLPVDLQAQILNSLKQIAESDGDYHDLEQALMAQVKAAWGARKESAPEAVDDGIAMGVEGEQGQAKSSQDYLFAAVNAWIMMSHIDGDTDATELEAAMEFAVRLGRELGMSSEKLVTDDFMEVFLGGGVRAQAGPKAQLEFFEQNIQVVAGAPHAVRKLVMAGLAVIAIKDGGVVPAEAALVVRAQEVLRVSLDEVTGKAGSADGGFSS